MDPPQHSSGSQDSAEKLDLPAGSKPVKFVFHGGSGPSVEGLRYAIRAGGGQRTSPSWVMMAPRMMSLSRSTLNVPAPPSSSRRWPRLVPYRSLATVAMRLGSSPEPLRASWSAPASRSARTIAERSNMHARCSGVYLQL